MNIAAHPPTPPARSDPFALGVRYLKREGPDGTVTYETVPLKPEDLLFPQEHDQVMYPDVHALHLTYFKGALPYYLRDRPGALVLMDHRVDFNLPGVEPLGPDVVVFFGVPDWDPNLATLSVAQTGARPQLVIEVTSTSTRNNDLGVKRDFYGRAGVLYYAIVDLYAGEQGDQVQLLGFRAGSQGLTPDLPDTRGWLWIEPLRLWMGLEDRSARVYDEDGRRILTHVESLEAAEAAEQRVEEERRARAEAEARIRQELEARAAAERRIEEATRRMEELAPRAEEVVRRAEEAMRRAEEEREARRQAEARAQALEERVRQLEAQLRGEAKGGDPTTEPPG